MVSVEDILGSLSQPSDSADAERLLNMLKVGAEVQKANAEIGKLEHEAKKAEQEASKAAVDAALASRQMRLQLISTLVAPLVPIAALLAVVATLYSSHQTLSETRSSDERRTREAAKDKEKLEWETFATTFNEGGLERVLTRPSLILKLSSYSKLPEYRKQLVLLSRSSFATMSSSDTFRETWSSIFGEVSDENFDTAVFVAKTHRRSYEEAVSECGKIIVPPDKFPEYQQFKSFGPCINALNRDAVIELYADEPETAKKVGLLKDRTLSESTIVYLLSEAISSYLRKNSGASPGGKELDISSMTFNNANLSNVDFSKMRLLQTDFFLSDVQGAILTAPTDKMTYSFRGTAWWEAAAIDQKVLGWLVANSYPGSSPQSFSRTGQAVTVAISEDQYRKEIGRLCTSQAPVCSPSCIKYGAEAPAKMQEVCSPK